MAIYTKSEVATLTGKAKAHISMGIRRNQLVVSVTEDGEEKIDTEQGNNATVIKKWTGQEVAKKTTMVQEPVKVVKTVKTVKAKPVIKTARPPAKKTESKKTLGKLEPKIQDVPVSGPSDNLEIAKKKADIENKIANTNHKNLQSAKLRGESIPTVMVVGVISELGNGFQLAYKSGAESLMMNFNHKYRIPPEAVAELKLKLIELINFSHNQAVGIAKDTINKILQDNASAEANKD